MATKKYQVEIDVNTGSVKIAGGDMLSLTQQVRVLQKELGKVDGKEFELLSNKLNETKDRAAAVNARSRELFGTLSLLPGPVGQFASKIDGAISLMKVFSGFSLGDIRAQFAALGADIAEIGKKIFAATGIQKIFQVTSAATAAVLRAVGIQATAASIGVRAFSTALVATGVGALVVGLGYLVTAFMNSEDAGKKFEDQLKAIREEQDKSRKSAANYTERQLAEARALGASEVELQKIRLNAAEQNLRTAQDEYRRAYNTRVDAEVRNKEQVKALKEDEDAKSAIVEEAEQKLALIRSEFKGAERQAREKADDQAEKDFNESIQKRLSAIDKGSSLEIAKLKKKQADEIAVTQNQSEIVDIQEKYEKQIFDIKKKSYEEQLKILKVNGKENTDEYRNIQIALVTLETENVNSLTGFAKQRKAIREKELSDFKNYQERVGEILDASIKNQTERELAQRKTKFEKDKESLINSENFQKESLLRQLQLLIALQQQYENDRSTIIDTGLKSEQDKENKRRQDRISLEAAEIDTKLKLQQAYVDGVIGFGQLLGAFAGKNKTLAIAAILIEQGANIARLLIDSAAQIGKINLRSKGIPPFLPIGVGIPNPVYVLAKAADKADIASVKSSTALSVAGIVAGAIKGISDISKAQTETSAPSSSNLQPVGGGPINVVASRAMGGFISGPGTTRSDSIPTFLSNGEFVVNARAAARFGGLLNQINSLGNTPQFSMDGFSQLQGTSPDLSILQSAPLMDMMSRPIRTYVTSQDMSSQQQLDRTIKQRSLL